MDSFPGGNDYVLSVDNGGIGFAPQHDAEAISDDVYDTAGDIVDMLIEGTLDTSVEPISGLPWCDVEQYRADEGCAEVDDMGDDMGPSDDSVLRVTYPIAEDAVWSDGSPITAADFVCTYQATINTPGSISTTGRRSIT